MKKNLKKIRVVAGAIFREDQLLVAKRSLMMSSPMLWELPGGKVEVGESDQAALQRELQEELGIDVLVQDFLAKSIIQVQSKEIEMYVYRCVIQQGEPIAKEHAKLGWVDSETLSSLRWAPADIPLISQMRYWLKGN